ncbi:MAG: hypothetical protein JSS32_07065 [Verrucomicrobia bacterium]|nr:hypothetical protein [Verrucomicrobiota bacterium]
MNPLIIAADSNGYRPFGKLNSNDLGKGPDFSFRRLISTVKELFLSLFSKLHPNLFLIHKTTRPIAYRAVENLGKKGFQLEGYTLEKYLEASKCNFVATFLTKKPVGAEEAKTKADEVVGKLIQKYPDLRIGNGISIPVIVKGITGSHIVNVKCRMANNQFLIDFSDSKGLSLFHPKNEAARILVKKISETFRGVVRQNLVPYQYDVHSCGVYVAWNATHDETMQPPSNINQFRSAMADKIARNLQNLAPEVADEDAVVALGDGDTDFDIDLSGLGPDDEVVVFDPHSPSSAASDDISDGLDLGADERSADLLIGADLEELTKLPPGCSPSSMLP